MVVQSLHTNKDPFWPPNNNEKLLGSKILYLSAISTPMYLTNNTHPDIVFSINLLARDNSCLIKRYWNEIKHVPCYLQGISDIRLFYLYESRLELTSYTDARFLFNLHKIRS